jgi:hypothetical protein
MDLKHSTDLMATTVITGDVSGVKYFLYHNDYIYVAATNSKNKLEMRVSSDGGFTFPVIRFPTDLVHNVSFISFLFCLLIHCFSNI